VAYSLATTGLGLTYLRLVSGRDAATSFFTAAPGGLNEMVTVGSQMGGDERFISVVHGMRIIVVVIAVPFWFRLFENYSPAARGGLGPALTAFQPADFLLLAFCLLGAAVASLLRLPAAALTGPMIVSAAIHLAGLTSSSPPGILVGSAQVVVGAALGSRFTGVSLPELGRIALVAVGLTAIMVGMSVVFAFALHSVTGLPLPALILAYIPGGLAEMSLVALALGLDAPFVATHHIARVLLIILLWPLMYALFRKLLLAHRSRRPAAQQGED
jgi:membrane AbrB-like protein